MTSSFSKIQRFLRGFAMILVFNSTRFMAIKLTVTMMY
ncbi:hypothetical protein F441_22383 [Phytophthora nicotianae CJ01A1]|uniref:Uncharacterized protein n=1 Tax=Phytophthora nicotianae CJ01A1 TaxID=1317063 RepID=W2VPN3_PHYNI|nr:hypothetical protein F441_22383 [Phytophthora nicotianae CJ01A1]